MKEKPTQLEVDTGIENNPIENTVVETDFAADPQASGRIAWRALEHTHTDKSKEWFIVLAIIFIAMIAGAVVLGEPVVAVFLAVAGVVLAIASSQAPEEVDIVIGMRGIRVADVFYPYEKLESFWIEEELGHRRLIVKSTKTLMPFIVTLMPDDLDEEMLTEYLLQHLAGEELHEPFFQQLLERFGF